MSSLHYNNSPIAIIYRQIIEDVLANVQQDFEELGIDESIMQELQSSWEAKIAQARPVNFPTVEPVQDVYALQPAMANPLSSNLAPQSSSMYRLYDERGRFMPGMAAGGTGVPQSMVDVYARKPGFGAADYQSAGGAAMLANIAASNAGMATPARPTVHPSVDAEIVRRLQAKRRASQQEGEGSQQPMDMSSREQSAQAADNGTAKPALSEKEAERQERKRRRMENGRPFDDPDDEINSDLDDTEDEDDDNEQDDDNNLILCLYEKVTRTKNKWKCTLKDGVMTVNGKDMLFQKANGEFEW